MVPSCMRGLPLFQMVSLLVLQQILLGKDQHIFNCPSPKTHLIPQPHIIQNSGATLYVDDMQHSLWSTVLLPTECWPQCGSLARVHGSFMQNAYSVAYMHLSICSAMHLSIIYFWGWVSITLCAYLCIYSTGNA